MAAAAAALAKAKGNYSIMSCKVSQVADDGTYCFAQSDGRQIYISKRLWDDAGIGRLHKEDAVHCKAFFNEKQNNYRADALVTIHRHGKVIYDARKSAGAKAEAPKGSEVSYVQIQMLEQQEEERARRRAEQQRLHSESSRAARGAPIRAEQQWLGPESSAAAHGAPIRIKTMVKKVVKTRVVRVIEHPVFGTMEESSEEEKEVEVEEEVEVGPNYLPPLEFPQDAIDIITALGFSDQQARNALGAFNGCVERAVLWLCDNPDPAVDEPLAGAPGPPPPRNEGMHSVSEDDVRGLVVMGFPEDRVRQVLAVMDAEHACNWLLENPGDVAPPNPSAASLASRPPASRPGAPAEVDQAGLHAGGSSFGEPELARVGSDKDAKVKSVLECLSQLIQQTKAGEFHGTELPLLYKQHPDASYVIKEAGGFKKFCQTHGQVLDYLPAPPGNPSLARVRLAAGAPLPNWDDDLAKAGMLMTGDNEAVVTGRVVNLLSDGAAFMETMEGGPNIYIPRKMAAGLEVGQMVCAVAENKEPGRTGALSKGRWRATKMNPSKAFVSEAVRKGELHAPLPRLQDDAGPAKSSASRPPAQTQDPRKALLRLGVSEEDAAQALFLFQDKFEEAVEWLKSENIAMHARPIFDASGQLDQDDGGLPKRPSGKDADAMLECVVREARKCNDELGGSKMSSIYAQRASAKDDLKAWGGLSGFCALRSETLEHVVGKGGRENAVRLKKTEEKEQTVPMRAMVTGLVVKEHDYGSYLMESVPGVADVYIPRHAIGAKQKLSVKQTVSVVAEEKVKHGTIWAAKLIKDSVLQYMGIVFASDAAETRYKELQQMSPAQIAQEKGLQVTVVTGIVCATHMGHLFLKAGAHQGAAGGDIWVPKELLENLKDTPQIGSYMTVGAVKNDQPKGNQLRAEYIDQMHGSNIAPEHVYANCVCGACGVCKQRAKEQANARMHVVHQGAEEKAAEAAAHKLPANPFALLGEEEEEEKNEDDEEASVSANSSESSKESSSEGGGGEGGEEEEEDDDDDDDEEEESSNDETSSESEPEAPAKQSPAKHSHKSPPQPQDKLAVPKMVVPPASASKAPPKNVEAQHDQEQADSGEASDTSMQEESSDESDSVSEDEMADCVKAGIKCKEDGNAAFRLAKDERRLPQSELAAEHYSRALEHFKKVFSLDQDTKLEIARTHANRAQCMINLQRPQDALDDCSSALKLDPLNWKALLRQSVSYVALADALVQKINKETEAKRGSKPKSQDTATRKVVSDMVPAKEYLTDAESCASRAYQIRCDDAKRDGQKPPSQSHSDHASVPKAIAKVRKDIDAVMTKVVSDGFWEGRQSDDSGSDQFEEGASGDSAGDEDDDDADSVSSSSTLSENVPVPQDLIMLVCPNVDCNGPLCLQSPNFESVRKDQPSYLTPPCPRCERRFRFESVPELPFKSEKGFSAEGLLPGTAAAAVWKQAKTAQAKGDRASGELYLDKAWQKLKAYDEQPRRNHAPISEYGDQDSVVPGRHLSGMRFMLEHCVHTRDGEMLDFLTGVPDRLNLSRGAHDESIVKVRDWVSSSWIYLMSHGILELILDSDEKHLEKNEPPADSIGGLFAVALASVLRLVDWLLKLNLDGMQWDWVFDILEPILDIREHASDLRIVSAAFAVDGLAAWQKQIGYNCIERFLSQASSRENLNALSLSCRSRRAKVVSAVLNAAPGLAKSVDSHPPLLAVSQLPSFATVQEVIINYPSVKRPPIEFRDWGFSWALRITKAGGSVPTQQWCNCGVHCFHKFTVSAQKRKEELQELIKDMDGKPFLSAHLDLKESQNLGPCRVKVTLRIQVAGLSEPQDFDIYYDHDNGVEGSPVHFMLVDDTQTQVLLDKGKNLICKISLIKLTARGIGIRKLRTPQQVEEEQEEIVKALIRHGAEVDIVGRGGQTALSLAIECGLSQSFCNLVIPKNVPAAISAMFGRKNLLLRELDLLLAHLPPKADALGIQVSAIVRRMGNYTQEKGKGKGDVSFEKLSNVLTDFLRRGVSQVEFNLSVKACVESRSWNVLDTLLNFKAEGLEIDASGLALHDVVATAGAQLLQLLLDAKANPNAVRTTHQADGETPLHVAARTGRLEAIEMLLQKKADCNVKEKKTGNTPLHEAATTMSGQDAVKVVELMILSGTDGNAKNSRKLTPLQVAKDKMFRSALQIKMDETQAAKKKMLERKRQEAANSSNSSLATEVSTGKGADAGGVAAVRGGARELSGVSAKAERGVTYEERMSLVNAMIDNFQECVDSVVPEDVGVGADQDEREEEDGIQIVQNVDSVHDELPSRDLSLAMPGSVVEWDMRFTRDFKEQFVMLRSRRSLMAVLIRVMQRLASGEVCEELMTPVRGTPIELNINVSTVQLEKGHVDLFVVWQWAPDYSPRIRAYCDTIRLFALANDEAGISTVADVIVQSHVRGRSSSVKRQLKPTAAAVLAEQTGDRRLPRTYEVGEWENVDELLQKEERRHTVLVGAQGDSWRAYNGTVLYTPPAIASADSYNVLKFYQLDDTILRNVVAPGAGHPLPEMFIPDEREDSFINLDLEARSSSMLLVGRSGTGKTSIAVGRMWSLFREWQTQQQALVAEATSDVGSGEGDAGNRMFPGYNQVFVTGNRVLRDQVRKSFSSMKQSYLLDVNKPLVTQYPPTWNQGVTHDMFPMFLTQTEWLLMLDGSLPDPFFPRNPDGSLQMVVEGGFHEEAGMLDNLDDLSDVEDDWFQDDDDDDHEEDDQGGEAEASSEVHQPGVRGTKGHPGKMRRKEIDWNYFLSRLWPKLTKAHAQAKNLSASAVFAEIHSFIKGSFSALDYPQGRLPREEYLRLPTKMAPNFKGLSASEQIADLPGDRRGNRDLVYELFLAYEVEKKRLNAYDISDLVHHLWQRLLKTPYSGTPIHALFVDETQDFVQAELRLFLHICTNKNDTFFSGDTCQTIASGVGFRFEDLKLLFRAEQESERREAEATNTHVAHPVAIPRVKNLQLNYRTHNGILSAAAGVVDLIECFFPSSIDILPRERGFFDGPKPLLLEQTNVDDAAVLIVGSDKKHSQIEFGAHQCILVRTQEAKKHLPEDFGGCLAMTILESKGLEFDDVFLWNFITDSRAEHEWRLVLSYLVQGDDDAELNALEQERAKVQNKDVSGMLRLLDFAEHQHQIFCEELKHLYTAITRARVRVIIYDEDVRKRAPMFHYLQRRDLVQTLAFFTADSYVPMAVQSSVDEWRMQGKNLRDNGLYQLAAKCFRQSRDEELELESYALHLSCRKAVELQGKERRMCFFEAGEKFLHVGQGVKAARCFCEAGEFDLAGKTFMMCTKGAKAEKEEGLLRDAIRSFRKGGKVLKALELLVQLGKLKTALRLLKDDHKYLKAIEVLESNPSFTPPADLSIETFIGLAAAQHAAARNAVTDESGRALATERFLLVASKLPEDEEEELLRRYGFRDALVELLVKRRRTVEAARIMCMDGKALEGALLLDSGKDDGREALELSTELHLSHALSAKCKDSDERSMSLSRALKSCRRVRKLDEEALKDAREKLTKSLEGGKDNLDGLGVGPLRKLAVQSGVKVEGMLLSATPKAKDRLEKLRQIARDVGLEISAPDKKTFLVAIEQKQCMLLRNAIEEKRRIETAGSALTASLRAEVLRLESIVENHSLQLLQIEFEHALRFPDGPERESRIKSALAAAKEGGWVVAVALLQHEAVLSAAQSAPSTPSLSLLEKMRDTLEDLDGVLRLLAPANKGKKIPIESPEYLKIEQFFGLKREGGMCCVSPTLKVLLDAHLDIGQCIKKGDLFVVEPGAFRKALVKETHRRAVDISLLIRNQAVQGSQLQSPDFSNVQMAMIRVWIVDDGIKRINASHDSNSERKQPVFRRRHIVTDTNLPKAAFSLVQRGKACEQLEKMMCPSIYSPEHDSIGTTTWKAVTDASTSWTEQFASARQAMRHYARSLYKTWQAEPASLKSAELFSRCLLVLERSGFSMDQKHLLNDLKRSGCDPWHPPLVLGFNSFFSLHMFFICKQQTRNSSWCWMAKFLSSCTVGDYPVDAWSVLEQIIANSVVLLSNPRKREDVAPGDVMYQIAEDANVTCVTYMPLSMASQFQKMRKAPVPILSEIQYTLLAGVRTALEILKFIRDCGKSSAAVENRVTLMIWTVLVNFVNHAGHAATHQELVSLWDPGWVSVLTSTISAGQLNAQEGPFAKSLGDSLRLLSIRPSLSGPLGEPMVPTAYAFRELSLLLGTSLGVVKIRKNHELMVTDEVDVSGLNSLLLTGARAVSGSKGVDAAAHGYEERDSQDWIEPLMYDPTAGKLGTTGAGREMSVGAAGDQEEEEIDMWEQRVLEQQLRAAWIICKFARFCLWNFALKGFRERLEKEAEEMLLLEATMAQPLSMQSRADMGDEAPRSKGVSDPFQRAMRYRMYSERTMGTHDTGLSVGLFNGSILLVDNSLQGFDQIKSCLSAFQSIYIRNILPVMIRADAANVEMQAFAAVGEFMQIPAPAEEVYTLLASLADATKKLEEALDDVDRNLLWERACMATPENEVRMTLWALESETLPRAEGTIAALMAQKQRYDGLVQMGIDVRQVFARNLAKGDSCIARSYETDQWTAARVLDFSERGYRLEFGETDDELFVQDTKREDVMPLAVNVPPQQASDGAGGIGSSRVAVSGYANIGFSGWQQDGGGGGGWGSAEGFAPKESNANFKEASEGGLQGPGWRGVAPSAAKSKKVRRFGKRQGGDALPEGKQPPAKGKGARGGGGGGRGKADGGEGKPPKKSGKGFSDVHP